MSALAELWEAKVYEPVKRLHDWFGYHGHRFPIKGGISRREAMVRNFSDNIMKRNPLLDALIQRGR